MYDLVALYIQLIVKHPIPKQESTSLLNAFGRMLNQGYTFKVLHQAIWTAFHNSTAFPFNQFTQTIGGNLVQQGVMYYHKELKLVNTLPSVIHDVDKGTLTSSETEFFVEPIASYTVEDLLKYFYSKGMADTTEYNIKRMTGFFQYLIPKYGIDKVLFMIEAAARMYDAEHKRFSITDFESYSVTASQYLEEIQNNCKYSGGDKYVPKRRMLFS